MSYIVPTQSYYNPGPVAYGPGFDEPVPGWGMRPESAGPQRVGVGEAPVGMPNPAAAACVARGGTSRTITLPGGGQAGMCDMPGGASCEEWALLRGEGCKDESGKAVVPVSWPLLGVAALAVGGVAYLLLRKS